MSIDPNSPEARKGAIGEKIVKTIFEGWGAGITRPDNAPDDSPTLIDFHAVPKASKSFKERLVEVKVRTAMPYAHGQYPCYTFPVVQIEAYEKYATQRGLPCELWIVDPEEETIFVGSLTKCEVDYLERKQFIDGREFPFDQMTKRGNMRFFHQKQFGCVGDLSMSFPAELGAIRVIDGETNADDKPTISDELAEFLDGKFHFFIESPDFVRQLPENVIKQLSELEKECGTNKVIYAISVESDIYFDGVRNFLNGDDDGTFEYIAQFARKEPDDTSDVEDAVADETPTFVGESGDENFPLVADILTAPNGTNIDILTVNGDTRFFVKVARVSSAVGYKDPSISKNSPLILAAKYLKVPWYRFSTQRLSGGFSYGKKGYYFAVEDVPKVLAQYYEFNCRTKGARQMQYNHAANTLRDWFLSTVLPKFTRKTEDSPVTKPVETPKSADISLKALLEQFAGVVDVDKDELANAVLELRAMRFEEQQKQLKALLDK